MSISTIRSYDDEDKSRVKAAAERFCQRHGIKFDASIGDTYGAELCPEGAQIIERAIASNGSSLALDLPAVERAVWGQNFSGSFWDRA